jgi:hypothetical protein
MITAAEAREIAKTSDVVCERLLQMLDPKIREAAEMGKSQFDTRHVDKLQTEYQGYSRGVATPLMTKMVDKLKALGYTAEFASEKINYREDPDEPDRTYPTAYYYFIRIRW